MPGTTPFLRNEEGDLSFSLRVGVLDADVVGRARHEIPVEEKPELVIDTDRVVAGATAALAIELELLRPKLEVLERMSRVDELEAAERDARVAGPRERVRAALERVGVLD